MEPGCNTDFDMDATPAPSGDGMDQMMGILQHQQTASNDEQLDRQMLRHLMSKYSAEGITRLMQEETSYLSRMCTRKDENQTIFGRWRGRMLSCFLNVHVLTCDCEFQPTEDLSLRVARYHP